MSAPEPHEGIWVTESEQLVELRWSTSHRCYLGRALDPDNMIRLSYIIGREGIPFENLTDTPNSRYTLKHTIQEHIEIRVKEEVERLKSSKEFLRELLKEMPLSQFMRIFTDSQPIEKLEQSVENLETKLKDHSHYVYTPRRR